MGQISRPIKIVAMSLVGVTYWGENRRVISKTHLCQNTDFLSARLLWIRLAKWPLSFSYSETAFMISNLAYKACNESWGTLVTFNDVLQNNLIKTFARECLLTLTNSTHLYYRVFLFRKNFKPKDLSEAWNYMNAIPAIFVFPTYVLLFVLVNGSPLFLR